MKNICALLFCVALYPIPQQPGVIYGPQGERLDTFKTPSGLVSYDEHGRRIERYEKENGAVWYDEQGRRWESYQRERGKK